MGLVGAVASDPSCGVKHNSIFVIAPVRRMRNCGVTSISHRHAGHIFNRFEKPCAIFWNKLEFFPAKTAPFYIFCANKERQ
ncbi:MAG: hypothetical protein UX72_C0034G0013 [Parcubacteria group bacterium GW2011_GWA2_47_10]|nr:MAG: hypothetical protein UX72_C0034G0013 [Parcubacteria group bacterium GW2011_GWA2_47_10]